MAGAVAALVVSALALFVLLAGPATAHPAAGATSGRGHQTPSSGTPTTTKPLLEGTTALPTVPTTTPKKTGAAASKAASDNRRVWYVVGGLVGAAVLLAALTIWYGFRTRPRRLAGAHAARPPRVPAEPEPAAAAATAPVHEARSRRPKRSVAGLDHVGSDNDYAPQATGEYDRIEPNIVRRSARPSRPAREEVIRASRRADRA